MDNCVSRNAKIASPRVLGLYHKFQVAEESLQGGVKMLWIPDKLIMKFWIYPFPNPLPASAEGHKMHTSVLLLPDLGKENGVV